MAPRKSALCIRPGFSLQRRTRVLIRSGRIIRLLCTLDPAMEKKINLPPQIPPCGNQRGASCLNCKQPRAGVRVGICGLLAEKDCARDDEQDGDYLQQFSHCGQQLRGLKWPCDELLRLPCWMDEIIACEVYKRLSQEKNMLQVTRTGVFASKLVRRPPTDNQAASKLWPDLGSRRTLRPRLRRVHSGHGRRSAT